MSVNEPSGRVILWEKAQGGCYTAAQLNHQVSPHSAVLPRGLYAENESPLATLILAETSQK